MNCIENPEKISEERELLRFTTVGSVDDGKSTLIGRLLYDSKSIFKDQMNALEKSSQLRGEDKVNLSLLTDGLRAEREQGITIDVAYRYFSTPKRKFIIADTPGHEQYTRNMVTGASTANLAVLLIDARNGVLTQSKRHGFIASLLGVPHMLVAVNKMDLVQYSEERFNLIVKEYSDFCEKLNIHDITFIPISALEGDNVVKRSEKMPWFTGHTVMHHLENVVISADKNLIDFRFPVQYVVRPNQDFRGFAGIVASGTIQRGEEVLSLPSKQKSRIKDIHLFKNKIDEAFASQSIIITLEDEIDVSRGDMLVRVNNVPRVSECFEAILCWMDDEKKLTTGKKYILQHTTRLGRALVDKIEYTIDVNTLHRKKADSLSMNEIGRVRIKTSSPFCIDPYGQNRKTGSFILVDPDSNLTVGSGMIRNVTSDLNVPDSKAESCRKSTETKNIKWEGSKVSAASRELTYGHKSAVLWFTGLSASGKSTIAMELEKQLFRDGLFVTRLDGDNVRHGLCSDLGFSSADRTENIRRIAEVSTLMAEAGMIVLSTFISPFKNDRDMARETVSRQGRFIEIYIQCPLEECRKRDPKGLYRRAENGEITEFTGIDSPYEEPERPELVIHTVQTPIDQAVSEIKLYLIDNGIIG